MKDWKKTNYPCRTCAKEGKEVMATGCFRPDLDLRGLCYCDEHKEAGQIEYVELISNSK